MSSVFQTAQVGRFCRQRGTQAPPKKVTVAVLVIAISVTTVRAVTVTVVVGLPVVITLRKRPSTLFSPLPARELSTIEGMTIELAMGMLASLLQSVNNGMAVIKILIIYQMLN